MRTATVTGSCPARTGWEGGRGPRPNAVGDSDGTVPGSDQLGGVQVPEAVERDSRYPRAFQEFVPVSVEVSGVEHATELVREYEAGIIPCCSSGLSLRLLQLMVLRQSSQSALIDVHPSYSRRGLRCAQCVL